MNTCKMNRKDEKRTKYLRVRLTEAEHSAIVKRLKKSNRNLISDYVRDIVLRQKVTIRQRNASLDDFLDEMVLLRKELNGLGNNFNQVVKKINASNEYNERVAWYALATSLQKELIEKVNTIKMKLDKFSDVWLHEL